MKEYINYGNRIIIKGIFPEYDDYLYIIQGGSIFRKNGIFVDYVKEHTILFVDEDIIPQLYLCTDTNTTSI